MSRQPRLDTGSADWIGVLLLTLGATAASLALVYVLAALAWAR